jgi:hypothetical protein
VVRLKPGGHGPEPASLDELTGGRMVLAPGACTDKHAPSRPSPANAR